IHFSFNAARHRLPLDSFPTRRSSDLPTVARGNQCRPLLNGPVTINAFDGRRGPWLAVKVSVPMHVGQKVAIHTLHPVGQVNVLRSEEHTSELQSRGHLVCRLLLEKKK